MLPPDLSSFKSALELWTLDFPECVDWWMKNRGKKVYQQKNKWHGNKLFSSAQLQFNITKVNKAIKSNIKPRLKKSLSSCLFQEKTVD